MVYNTIIEGGCKVLLILLAVFIAIVIIFREEIRAIIGIGILLFLIYVFGPGIYHYVQENWNILIWSLVGLVLLFIGFAIYPTIAGDYRAWKLKRLRKKAFKLWK